MAPAKFDDLAKPASDVLTEDYQTKGFQLKAKQKTSWNGAVATTTVDLFPDSASNTPAKLSWKFPNAFGLAGVSVDKLEMDKGGKFKMEVSADTVFHKVSDLKVETKSDLVDPATAVLGLTYTGVPATLVKFDTKVMNPSDFSLEVTRAIEKFTLGVRLNSASIQAPDFGVSAELGPVSAAVLDKDKLSSFSVLARYSAAQNLKLAGWYQQAKKSSYGAGLAYSVDACKTLIKAKINQDGVLFASVKHEKVKGFTVSAGGSYDISSGKPTYGVQLSIE